MWWSLVLSVVLGCVQVSSQGISSIFVNGTCCGRTCYNGMMICHDDTILSCFCVLSSTSLHCIQLPPPQTNRCDEGMTCNSADQECNCQILNVHGSLIRVLENFTGSCVNIGPVRSISTVPVSAETSSGNTVISTTLTPLLTSQANTTDHYGGNTLLIAIFCVGGVVVVAAILTVAIHVFRRKRKGDNPQPPRGSGTYGNTELTPTPEGVSVNIQTLQDNMTDTNTGIRTYETLAVDRTSEDGHNYTSVSSDYLTPASNPLRTQERGGNSQQTRTSPVYENAVVDMTIQDGHNYANMLRTQTRGHNPRSGETEYNC